jgi:hypothetical protein
MTCLSMLRAQHIACADAAERRHIQATIEQQSGRARELGARLLEIDVSMLKMQTRNAPLSPLDSAPLDF